MSSRSFINVDWKRLASSYDNTFGTKTAEGSIRHPTAGGAYNWIVDFVTANFQRTSPAHIAQLEKSADFSDHRASFFHRWYGPRYPSGIEPPTNLLVSYWMKGENANAYIYIYAAIAPLSFQSRKGDLPILDNTDTRVLDDQPTAHAALFAITR